MEGWHLLFIYFRVQGQFSRGASFKLVATCTYYILNIWKQSALLLQMQSQWVNQRHWISEQVPTAWRKADCYKTRKHLAWVFWPFEVEWSLAAIHGRLVVEDNSGGALKEVTPLTNEFKMADDNDDGQRTSSHCKPYYKKSSILVWSSRECGSMAAKERMIWLLVTSRLRARNWIGSIEKFVKRKKKSGDWSRRGDRARSTKK